MMLMIKKFFGLSILLSICGFGLIFLSCVTSETIRAAPSIDAVSGLGNKLKWLKQNAVSGGNYVISLGHQEIYGTVWYLNNTISNDLNLFYKDKSNITITLRGVGDDITIRKGVLGNPSPGTLFTVGNGVTLVLENIAIKGTAKDINNNNALGSGGALVVVSSGGTLVMNNGSAIIDGFNNEKNGGGVFISDGGTFHMKGGTISGNISSRVKDAIIRNVTQYGGQTKYTYGGGVYVSKDGTFTKTGGIIYGYRQGDRNGNSVQDPHELGNVLSGHGHAVYAGTTAIDEIVDSDVHLSFRNGQLTRTATNTSSEVSAVKETPTAMTIKQEVNIHNATNVASTSSSQIAQSVQTPTAKKPRLTMRPFTGGTANDGETITALFSIQSGLRATFDIVTDDDADWVFTGEVIAIGERNLLITSIVHPKTSRILTGGYRLYQKLEELPKVIPAIAEEIAIALKRSVTKPPRLVIVPFIYSGQDSPEVKGIAKILPIAIANTGKYAILPPNSTAMRTALDELKSKKGNIDFSITDSAKTIGAAINADYALFVETRKLGNANLLIMRILDTKGGNLLVGESLSYSTIEDGTAEIPRFVNKLTATVPSSSQSASTSAMPMPNTGHILAIRRHPNTGGTVSRTPNQIRYSTGTTVVLTATPLTGYTFTGWTGGIVSENPRITLTIDRDTVIYANFAANDTNKSNESRNYRKIEDSLSNLTTNIPLPATDAKPTKTMATQQVPMQTPEVMKKADASVQYDLANISNSGMPVTFVDVPIDSNKEKGKVLTWGTMAFLTTIFLMFAIGGD